MSIVEALRVRLRGRPDSEHEQAILRVMILSLVTVYGCWYVSLRGYGNEHEGVALIGLLSWLVASLGIFAAIWIWPSANAARRMLGIVADVGAITFGLFVMGGEGAVLVGAYLFFIFGNGFRYGRFYLHVSQLLSLVGFVLVVFMVPWWQHEMIVGMGWLISLIVLPFYVGILAERISQARMTAQEAFRACDQARMRAEEALKACIERGQIGGTPSQERRV